MDRDKELLEAYKVLIAHFTDTNLRRVAAGQEPLTEINQGLVDPESLIIHDVTISFSGTAEEEEGCDCCADE